MEAAIKADIESVLTAIFATMFQEDLGQGEPMDPDEHCVTGVVPLTGACEGALVLRCQTSLARWLAHRMFALDRPAQPDEVADAVGEVSNMAAGNIRAILAQPCQIGLPVVAFGADYGVSIIGSRARAQADLACPAGRVSVSLVEHRRTDPAPAGGR